MAVHFSHACLPYPIKGARFSLLVPSLDADGDPTAQTTPDTEVSKDGAAAADAAEEMGTISGMTGLSLITWSGAETDCAVLAAAFKAASGPKDTLGTFYPRPLAIVGSGTLSAGSAGGGTLGTLLAYDVTGCFIKTTGGTGGGGTGGANNQARKMVTYTPSTGAFTVGTNWETTPSTDTTYDVLLPEGVTLGMLRTLNPTTAGRTLDVSPGGEAGLDWANVGSPTTTVGLSGTTVKTVTDIASQITALLGAVADAAATGDPGSTAVIPLVKQLVNILIGSDGVATYPAAAAPGNAVSLAEVLRSVYTQLGVAGAGLSALPWNATWDAEVQSEVQDAIEANHLDHLLATTYDPASKPGAADALLNELVESDAGVARYTANALEQAPTGGSAPTVEQIADQVWDEATAGHTTSGTFGEQVKTDIDAIGLKTTNLPTDPADQSAVETAITNAQTAILSVLGALADAAADGDPTSADTVMAYVKQLVNTLVGTAGIPTYPSAAAPGNGVSLAEALRQTHDKVSGLTFGVANVLNANITHINETALVGTGVLGDEWDAA